MIPRPFVVVGLACLAGAHGLWGQTPPLRLKAGSVPANQLEMMSGYGTFVAPASLYASGQERMHLLLHARGEIGAALRGSLALRDVRILAYMPDNGLLVSGPTDAAFLDLDIDYAAALNPENKLSPLLGSGGAPRQSVVVQFHDDVDASIISYLINRPGVSIQAHPDLLSGAMLVYAPLAALRELAAADEVQYIYPASNALAKGLPVAACMGGGMEASLPAAAALASTFGDGWDGAGLGSANLSWWLGDVAPGLNRADAHAEIARALACWSAAAQLQFTCASAPKSQRSIDICFAARSHGDGFNFDGKGGVLAHTFYPPPNSEPLAGDMHLDIEESWMVGADTDVFSVVLHELGHSLGLGHNDDPDSVMYPYYQRLNGLRDADVAALRKLYAAPGETVPASPAQPNTPAQPATPPDDPAPDKTPPSVTITSPSGVLVGTSAGLITITGRASDNVAVSEVTWANSAGGSGVAVGLPVYSAGPIALALGQNRITVTANDAAGNRTSRTVVVTRR